MTTTTAAPPRAGQLVCKNHPEATAVWQCSRCGGTFCDPCLRQGPQQRVATEICPACKGFCRTLIASGPARPRSFGELVNDAVAYPFRGAGIFLLLLGVVFFALLKLLSLSPLYGSAFAIIGSGYLAAFIFRILNSSAAGDEELPDWPEFTDFYDSIFVPFWQLALTATLSYGAAVAALFFLGLTPLGVLCALALALAGAIYFPMALLSVALNGSILGARPSFVFGGIRSIAGPYLGACLVMSAIFGASTFGLMVLEAFLPYVGAAINGFVSLFLLTVKMRIIGLLYFTYQERFPWFR